MAKTNKFRSTRKPKSSLSKSKKLRNLKRKSTSKIPKRYRKVSIRGGYRKRNKKTRGVNSQKGGTTSVWAKRPKGPLRAFNPPSPHEKELTEFGFGGDEVFNNPIPAPRQLSASGVVTTKKQIPKRTNSTQVKEEEFWGFAGIDDSDGKFILFDENKENEMTDKVRVQTLNYLYINKKKKTILKIWIIYFMGLEEKIRTFSYDFEVDEQTSTSKSYEKSKKKQSYFDYFPNLKKYYNLAPAVAPAAAPAVAPVKPEEPAEQIICNPYTLIKNKEGNLEKINYENKADVFKETLKYIDAGVFGETYMSIHHKTIIKIPKLNNSLKKTPEKILKEFNEEIEICRKIKDEQDSLDKKKIRNESYVVRIKNLRRSDREVELKDLADILLKYPYYIELEFCTHSTLEKALYKKRNEQIESNSPPDRILENKWTKEIYEGINWLHSIGIMHGDIHDKNILICGDDKTAKLTDFGLSIDNIDDTNVSIYNSTGKMGPASPPIRLGHFEKINGNFKRHIDYWAFGCLLIEIFLEGQVPMRNINDFIGPIDEDNQLIPITTDLLLEKNLNENLKTIYKICCKPLLQGEDIQNIKNNENIEKIKGIYDIEYKLKQTNWKTTIQDLVEKGELDTTNEFIRKEKQTQSSTNEMGYKHLAPLQSDTTRRNLQYTYGNVYGGEYGHEKQEGYGSRTKQN